MADPSTVRAVADHAGEIAQTFAAVVAAGAEPSLAPTTAPDGVSLVAFVRDPDGNLVEFLQRPARPAR